MEDSLQTALKLPDLWQQRALRALQERRDVVLQAPTGAGKTYIFELLVEKGLRGQAIYTVPTRALANDKLLEWRRRRWNVGITTGDISENLNAPVIVATLETQKFRFIRGEGPALLVIDEYQMLADSGRGVNYEMVIAAVPQHTQLLLMSGSVANPHTVATWLRRLGRRVECVQHHERPVPLDEVHTEALPDNLPSSIQGFWPTAVAKVLKAGMAPLLVFAPRRQAAESLARTMAQLLPEKDPLILTDEQQAIAGDHLGRMLKARIAYHHSGLDYRQRAGLVEPLAKAGQLRLVVATMGLASGINFSMRSVMVTDREYRSGESLHMVRSDELLQMFGRAGRRGIDKKGFIVVAPGKPRLAEARPLHLKRTDRVDWPGLIHIMVSAQVSGRDSVQAVRAMAARLFSDQPVPLGLRRLREQGPADSPSSSRTLRQTITEFATPDGNWERVRTPTPQPLHNMLVHTGKEWLPALRCAEALRSWNLGNLCRLSPNGNLGREVPLARWTQEHEAGELVITRWLQRTLRSFKKKELFRYLQRRDNWTLAQLEAVAIPLLPNLVPGLAVDSLPVRNDTLYARLDFANVQLRAQRCSNGRALLNPPTREMVVETDLSWREPESAGAAHKVGFPADWWFQFGLIDHDLRVTTRGILFSFFNHGEGLAIAAALEDTTYPIEDMVIDLANLRAGHRFSDLESFSGRLGSVCRAAYKSVSCPGLLNKGVPVDYGDGAAEAIQGRIANKRRGKDFEIFTGDVERVRLEWASILNQIHRAPDLNWQRWRDLKQQADKYLALLPKSPFYADLPALTATQSQRHKSFLKFD